MLTLLVPGGLLALRAAPPAPTDSSSASPASARSLRRARAGARQIDPEPAPRRSPREAWLARAFGLPAGTPVGAWSAFDAHEGDYTPHPGRLTATPVHLAPGIDHLVLHPASVLAIEAEEAAALANTANQHFEADGWSLVPLTPDCWSMNLGAAIDVDWASTAVAQGRSIDAYMPHGPDARRLRAMLNELQMLWHAHPVNASRAARGLPAINALWPEGEARTLRGCAITPAGAGADSTARPAPFERVFSDARDTRGLARAAGLSADAVLASGAFATAASACPADEPWLLEWPLEPADAQAAADFDELLQRARPVRVVLTDDREWRELLPAVTDRWAFWRGDAIR